MESDECICVNYYLRRAEAILQTVLSTTRTMIGNTNAPVTDSGYVSNQIRPDSSSRTFPFENLIYFALIISALMLLMTKLKRKDKTSSS